MNTYKTNKHEAKTLQESWFWPVDTCNNVLIDPSTLDVTKDQWDKLTKYFGFDTPNEHT